MSTTQETVQKDLANPENIYGPTNKQVNAVHNKIIWLSGQRVSDIITIIDAFFEQGKKKAEYKKNLAAGAVQTQVESG